MNKEAVQHERGPRNSTIRKQMADLSSASQIGFSPSQFSPLMRSPIPNLYPFTTYPTTPSSIAPNITIPTPDKMIKNEPQYSPPPIIKHHNLPPTPPPVDLTSSTNKQPPKYCETAANILYINAKMVRYIPAFQLLPAKDQERLYSGAWLKLFILGCAQYLTLEDLDCLKNNVKVSLLDLSSFISTVKIIKSLQLSETEFGYVRNVILFRQSRDVTEKLEAGVEMVEQIGDHAHLALAQAMMIKTERNSLQFAKTMMILNNLATVSSTFIHELFFKATIGDISMDLIVLDVLRSQK